ncbi:hypothetical protein [Shewanella algae]|uniref:hypothetical protein n=1 Tax=Shewanella algae TaxID=38313 RepID=UPI001AAFA492|nr:hypothetical protein [Shewanella algae]MBO2591354.1 hypothetical protein [Shewanella algae]
MSRCLMKLPRIKGTEARPQGKMPELLLVNYDLWTLRLTFSFQPNQVVYVDFQEVEGFRVLDEGQLLEFWGKESKDHWVFEVLANGWLAVESSRETAPAITEGGQLKEYLVAGINECVSVMAFDHPKITYNT